MSALRVISLGAGVQSTAVLMLALTGEIQADAAIFADTGWEPRAVYEHLARLVDLCAGLDFPLHIVTAGNIRDDSMTPGRFASMPFHIRNVDGSKGMARRQCTREYKVAPIRRQVRDCLAEQGRKRATMLLGISQDETQRMRDSDVQYISNEYPLVDRQWTRQHCEHYLADRGWTAPRSACLGCPFHSTREWLALSDDEVRDVREFEVGVSLANTRFDGGVFLHSSLLPIDAAIADLRDVDDRSPRLWDDECAGVCGV